MNKGNVATKSKRGYRCLIIFQGGDAYGMNTVNL